MERGIAVGLLFVVVALTYVAALTEPNVLDALSYRLPRTGHWLQEGRIDILASQDARMNFVAVVPDIVAAWVLGAKAEGFRLSVVTQMMGGVLMLGATMGLARQTGLSRCASLLAGVLPLGMANVVGQCTAGQTDLFTAGLFASAFYLWLCALRRGEVSVPGVAGAGLAIGAKGTVFYFAPTALVWVAWLAWRHPLRWRQWGVVVLVAGAGLALFAGPAFLRNAQAYGGIFGPKSEVKKHHRGFASVADLADKLRWNLTSSLAQNLEPHSQPVGLREASLEMAARLVAAVPAHDAHSLDALDRHDTLRRVLQRGEPDADVLAFGVVTLGLFVAGLLMAVVRRSEPGGRLVLIWAGGVAVFFLFFHGMHQWHPFSFRYQVLAAPWIAVVGAWGIGQLPLAVRRIAWGAGVLAAANVAWHVTTQTHQSGWQAVVSPELYREGFVARQWRAWSEFLDGPLALALPSEQPLAAFYRQRAPRSIAYVPEAGGAAETAAALVGERDGWVVVQAGRYMGREGAVAGRTFLFDGDPTSPFSLAAYRRLQPGEAPAAILYRNRRERRGAEFVCELLVRPGPAAMARLRLGNPTGAARNFSVETPLGVTPGRLDAESVAEIEVALPATGVVTVRVVFGPTGVERSEDPQPVVQLAGGQ